MYYFKHPYYNLVWLLLWGYTTPDYLLPTILALVQEHTCTHTVPPPPPPHTPQTYSEQHNIHKRVHVGGYTQTHTQYYTMYVHAGHMLHVHIDLHLHYTLVFMKKIERPCLIHMTLKYLVSEISLSLFTHNHYYSSYVKTKRL